METYREERRRKEYRKMTSIMKKNLYGVFFVILVLCGILIGRLVYLNNVNGEKYAKAVLSQQSYSTKTVASERGKILDRNGVVLARSEKTYNVVIDPKVINSQDYYLEPTLKGITQILGYDENEISRLIRENADNSYIVYEKDVDYSKVSEFNKYKSSHKFVVGVWFEEEYKRIYPHNSFASHVIGFVNDGSGNYGLEQYYNDELTGTDGISYGYYDSELNMQKVERAAQAGDTLITTLDYNIQTIIEEKVAEFNRDIGCNNIGVIVMDPSNGEILGMTSNREFDLNEPRKLEGVYPEEELEFMTDEEKLAAMYRMWRNFCVSDTYEPGSTFKTITVAAALEEDKVFSGSTFECKGFKEVGGWKIGCNSKSGHGNLNLAEALMKSCNCALMDIAEKLGPDTFFKYEKRFGFGRRTGVDLTGESAGIIIDRKNLRDTELATSSFGTTFNVTMVQVAAAYCSILNGGSYYNPHVVSQIRRSDQSVVKISDNTVETQTVSRKTSDFIRDALYMTVEQGTATPAKVKGYLIGGKTGTAQKRPREEKKYVVSFAGFAPVDNPKVLVYIVIDEVHDPEMAGSSGPATRMCASIMKEILPYLGLYPAEGGIEYHVDYDLIGNVSGSGDGSDNDELNSDVLPEGLD
ncbi:MAG: penicillin-binding protein 2 [Lachnospiraceae bacterium]|nr:penicillin-binding protein 2 [Lachnospiraceae bacterium]